MEESYIYMDEHADSDGSIPTAESGTHTAHWCIRSRVSVANEPNQTVIESDKRVSYRTLHRATDGFSSRNLIGKGSFSSVYRGRVNEDGGVVAVKVLNLHRRGGFKSFISECETLRNTRHRNLAKVITCCSSFDFQGNEFKAMVYEFMSNGSLEQWLHYKVPQLSLLQRVCIALDVAYALDYLHHHAGETIIHCDIKPSNILLNQDFVAHVGDFGLSKILHSEYQYRLQSSSEVRGTVGYAAPEYGVGSKVSRSGDMYSYGILLLEMITTKKPTASMFRDGLSLHDYAKTAMGDGAVFGIVDPFLTKNDEMCLRLLVEIGVSCSMGSPQHRMDMASVIQQLQLVKDGIFGNSALN